MGTAQRRLIARAALALASVAVAWGGCGDGDESGDVPSDESASTALDTVLSVAPADAEFVSFIDWSAIKLDEGAESLNSDSPEAERSDFFNSVGHSYGVVSEVPPDFEGRWGWGSSDLAWEAELTLPEGLLLVLGFPDGFDLGAITDRFIDCGYRRLEGFEQDVYERTSGPTEPCFAEVDDQFLALDPPALRTVAFDTESNLLLASPSEDLVATALRENDALLGNPAVIEVLEPLETASVLILAPAFDFCTRLAEPIFLGGPDISIDALEEALSSEPPGGPYHGFALGYEIGDSLESGRIVFRYEDAADAQADLEGRSEAIETGVSPVTGDPYADVITLDSAEVEGTSLVFDVSPAEQGQRGLGDLASSLDFAFARC